MARETVTVRLEPETRDTLDQIAAVLERDRSHVINEALAAYIETHQWQVAHIRQGLKEADAGQFVPEAEMEREFKKLRRNR